MTRPELLMLAGLLVAGACGDGQDPGAVRLFDGISLNGWEGDTALWRVVDGAIVGGTLKTPVTQSEYLCTQAEFADFELQLDARINGPNAGVHFRSQRVPGSNEVAGYQADIGFALAGSSQRYPTPFRTIWSGPIHCGVVSPTSSDQNQADIPIPPSRFGSSRLPRAG